MSSGRTFDTQRPRAVTQRRFRRFQLVQELSRTNGLRTSASRRPSRTSYQTSEWCWDRDPRRRAEWSSHQATASNRVTTAPTAITAQQRLEAGIDAKPKPAAGIPGTDGQAVPVERSN